MPKVVVLGSINLDFLVQVPRLAQPGETIAAAAMRTSPGGKGANQAAAARRLGVATRLLGAVGNDAFAEAALAIVRRLGVDLTEVVTVEGNPTGLAWVEVDASGQNRITVVAGANAAVGAEAVARLSAMVSAGDVLLLQGEIPPPTVVAAARAGKERGAVVFLDPAPPHPDLRAALPWVDVLLPNQGEAAALWGKPVENLADALAAARRLAPPGGRAVVKLGGQGLVWASASEEGVVPATPVAVQDTTGAGDVLAGSLAGLLVRGWRWNDALQRAAQLAAESTAYPGVQEAVLHLEGVPGA